MIAQLALAKGFSKHFVSPNSLKFTFKMHEWNRQIYNNVNVCVKADRSRVVCVCSSSNINEVCCGSVVVNGGGGLTPCDISVSADLQVV